MAKVYRSHFGSSCIILPHPPTPIPVSREEAWKVYLPPASTLDPSGGRGPGLGGNLVPKEARSPFSNFPGRCRGFSPLVFVTRGFSPLWPSSPCWTCTFFGQRGKGDPPPFCDPLYVPGTHPTPFERLGMRDLRPPLGSTCTKVGLLLQGCTIVVAATHGGGAAAP